jgi:hypothetical protein
VTARDVYTARAVAAVIAAARAEHGFAGWLAQVLAAAAGQLGSSDELIIGRPGSWEASFVDQLVKGTVGHDDEYLPGPAGNRKLTDAKVRDIRWRYDPLAGVTEAALAAEFGVSPSTVSDIVTGKTWGWLKRTGVAALGSRQQRGRDPRQAHERRHPARPLRDQP